MRGVIGQLIGYFLTPWGLVLLAALDSSVVFFFPLGVDVALIVMSARSPSLFWLYALLATAGSVAGAALTFWMGRKVGEHGLRRFVRPGRLRRIQARVGRGAGVGIGALAVVPPPFPLTPFVLTSGALATDPKSLLLSFAVARLLRFTVEGALAARFGSRILRWMDSTVFEVIVGALIALAVVGTVVSVAAFLRSDDRSRSGERERKRKE